MRFFGPRTMPIAVAVAATLFVGFTAWGFINENVLFENLVPKTQAATGRHFVELLARRDYAAIEAALDPSLKGASTRSELEQAASVFPSTHPAAITPVGFHWSKDLGGTTTYNLTYEVAFPGRWFVARAVFTDGGGKIDLKGLRVQRLDDSLERVNGFASGVKSPTQYLGLLLIFGIGAFMIATMIVCGRTPGIKRKWLWMVFIAIGIVEFSINWTTGQFFIQPISFYIPAISFYRAGPYAPWIFIGTLPLGAILFWIRRPALIRSQAIPAPDARTLEPTQEATM
jgi:hypothetical protein